MTEYVYKAPPGLDISSVSFKDWLTDISIWSKLPQDSESKGIILYVSLEGKAKNIVRQNLTVDQIVHETDGVKNIVDL